MTPWTVAYQAPWSMGFSRQAYLSGLPFTFPGDLPDPGIEPRSPHCRQTLYRLTQQGSPYHILKFNSAAQSCLTLCNPMYCSTPGLLVHHQLPELTQTHVHGIGDAIQPSHALTSPSPPAFNLSQYQGLFQWVSLSHQVARVSELQLQHQSFQWMFRTDFL